MSGPYEHILYEVVNEVALIILNRPDKLNVIGVQTREELVRALTLASDDDRIGAVLIRGNGRAFCAGGDLGQCAVNQ
jgi:enoyl-CoA hydratase/carnithine racemase